MNRRDIDQGDGIVTIDTGYQRDGLVASHLIQQGDLYAFVDVGSTSCLHNIHDVMRKREIKPEQIKYIMVTHVHLDHAGAAGVLMRECPEAELVVHPRGARHMADPTKLIAGASAVYGEDVFKKFFGEVLPVDVDRIIEVSDEQTLSLNGRPLIFLDTPGHAKHHYCVYDELSSSFFTGDTFGLAYEALTFNGERFIFPTTTPVQFDPQALHQSIDRMMTYLPRQMFLTHFGRVDDPAKKADNLHRHIESFVSIAEQSYSNQHEECTSNLFTGLLSYLKTELEQLGSKLNEKEILAIMSVDLNLNAQGLCCWLDHKNKK